jgi:hypothetical protein
MAILISKKADNCNEQKTAGEGAPRLKGCQNNPDDQQAHSKKAINLLPARETSVKRIILKCNLLLLE